MKRRIIKTSETTAEDRNRIIGQVMLALKSATPKTADSIINEVKFYLNGGHSRANLDKLFDSQFVRLKRRGVNNDILEKLQAKRCPVISQALALDIPFDRIPFVPVITKRQINLKMLLPLIFHDSKAGATRVEQHRLSDNFEAPTTPYYIIDIEDGSWLLHIAPLEAEATIEQVHRECLTDCEVIALSLHTNVLARHYLMALGSRYGHGVEEQFPDLHLCDGKPILDWRHLKSAPAKEWGAPSYAYRL